MTAVATKIDIGKALKLRMRGLSLSEVGNQFGASKQAVSKALEPFKGFLKNPETVNAFQNNRADVFDAIINEYARHLIDEDTIKKTSGMQAASIMGILYDKMRLETGKTTSNQAVLVKVQKDLVR